MEKRESLVMFVILTALVLVNILLSGCAGSKTSTDQAPVVTTPPLTMVHQIDSFKPDVACSQALEVLNHNPYSQDFFDKVFGRVVEQFRSSKAETNAEILWDHLVVPLKQSGKVPPDLA